MALVVEDGTGTLVGANSYESVAEFNAYCAARGMEITASYNDTDKERALIKSTEYIDLVFGKRFQGRRLLSTQALRFPRAYLYDPEFCYVLITGIPVALKSALSEYAYRELITPGSLMPDPTVDPTGRSLQASFEKVGPIEERLTYFSATVKTIIPFPKADRYLQDFIGATGATSYRA